LRESLAPGDNASQERTLENQNFVRIDKPCMDFIYRFEDIMKRLDRKLQKIRNGTASREDFIIADAKDADMAFGIAAPGPSATHGWKTLAEYREQIRAIVAQDLVDVMLMSASTLEQLAMRERLFHQSEITPAARANDTTDIWLPRGGIYHAHPSRPFRSATLDHIKYGRLTDDHQQEIIGADLGLYSLTFVNQLDHDHRTLEAFHDFRIEAEKKHFRYFLEVFYPNIDAGISAEKISGFVNDHIVRSLAGVTETARPLFLKIPYGGPRALEELITFDPQLVVGILGGGAGTTLDAFQLIHDAQKYGAQVALFGRKINLSEDPLAFLTFLRGITDGHIKPIEAVKAYHAQLSVAGIKPHRLLEDDLTLTEPVLRYS
jgi:hypothetical protein